jgi:hypothetical protein
MSATMPIAAPIPAFAAVEIPGEEDLLSSTNGFEFVVGFAVADMVDAMVEEAIEVERLLDVAVPNTVPNNYMNVIFGIRKSSLSNLR